MCSQPLSTKAIKPVAYYSCKWEMLRKFWEVRRKQNYKWFLPVSTRWTSSSLFIAFEFSTRHWVLWSLIMCLYHFDFSWLESQSCQDSPLFRSYFRNVTRSVYMRQRKESAASSRLVLSRNLPWSASIWTWPFSSCPGSPLILLVFS